MGHTMATVALLLSGAAAGWINAIAGGGPVITFAALTALGIDPRLASMTSTVALSPGQIVTGTGWRGSGRGGSRERGLTPGMLVGAAVGGAGGAQLLLATPAVTFQRLAPWLVLFATVIYAWVSRPTQVIKGAGGRPVRLEAGLGFAPALTLALAGLGIYGGYFGGGNSFLVLGLLALVRPGHPDPAGQKNAAIAAMNAGACVVLLLSAQVLWACALPLGAGGVAGSWLGSRWVRRMSPAALRGLVVAIGLALSAWLLVRA